MLSISENKNLNRSIATPVPYDVLYTARIMSSHRKEVKDVCEVIFFSFMKTLVSTETERERSSFTQLLVWLAVKRVLS